MTFTYSPFTADKDRVRFHTGDTDSTRAWFTDEEITAIITEAGSWQSAVIACIQNIIARLSGEPDFRADWLQVSQANALKSFRALLKDKARELGVALSPVRASVGYVYRADSNQSQEPTYPLSSEADNANF
jgi:hypothetical protein